MQKSNFLRKSDVLNNGDYDNYRFVRQMIQSQFRDLPISEKNPFSSVEEALAYDTWKRENDKDNWLECERLDHARIQRVSRLREKVGYMLRKFDCNFVTLTFSPDVLSKTSPETRHQYVSRWLGTNFVCGIGNLDFGGKFNREHYHCIVPVSRVCHDTWKFGLVKGETIVKCDNAVDKISCYTAKLVNHAIKETTKGCRTIYSGRFPVKPNLKCSKCDENEIAFKKLNSKLLDKADYEYEQMLKNGQIKTFNSLGDRLDAKLEKTHSERFLTLSDSEQAYIDDLFLGTL